MRCFLLICCLCLVLTLPLCAQEHFPALLPERQRAALIDELLSDRLNHLLPALMRREGIDLWILSCREYNEDPVLKTMLPATWLSARRRTILAFFDQGTGKGVEKLAIARYNVGEAIKAAWDMQQFPDQWDALVYLIQTRNPRKIALNYSTDFAHADGLSYTEYQALTGKLPDSFKRRIVSAQSLAVAWLETRTAREMMIYPQLVRLTHQIVQEGFSEKTILPGVTTSDDVVWWFRQRFRELGVDTWFHPSVSIQRSDSLNFDHLRAFANRPANEVILPGDLLHVDIGITYLRLNSDVQQHAYVLRAGETEVPLSIRQAFEKANRLQDILTGQFKAGKTGNQILADALAQAKKEGITASIYTHPIGYHGHAAGPTIGLWDHQEGVPGSGNFPLHNNTAYSIELNAASYIPEWKKTIRIMLEEDGFYDEQGFRFIGGRQTEVYAIPRKMELIK